MTKLLSGEEAKLAWANGEQLQVAHTSMKEWDELDDNYLLSVFDNDSYIFRIKPRTILINEIEVPAPFEPEEGERYWYLTDNCHGYGCVENKEGCRVGIAAWRTEEEIKQVVAALRSVFEVAHDQAHT